MAMTDTAQQLLRDILDRFDALQKNLESLNKDSVELKIEQALIKQDTNRNTASIGKIKDDQITINTKVNRFIGGVTVIVFLIPIGIKLFL